MSISIDTRSPAWHEVPCDQLLLVRDCRSKNDGGTLILAAQLRGSVVLPDETARAIAVLIREYAGRREPVTLQTGT